MTYRKEQITMKKKSIAVLVLALLVMSFCGAVQAMQYPELGVCTGENVRIRASAGTKGKVIDRADAGTQFIILGETRANGKKWYRIDLPKKKGSAYIAAEFVNGYYNGGKHPVGREFAEIRLNLGITPEKTRLLLGRPSEESRELVLNKPVWKMTYPGCDLIYDEGYLMYVHIQKRGYEVAGCQVGDKANKLVVFGMPEDEVPDLRDEKYDNWDAEEDGPIGPEGWTYESASGEEIFFGFGYTDDEVKIESITWHCPIGEG